MDYPKSLPGVGLVNGKFVDENPLMGTPGSLIPAGWGNAVTAEILAVIKQADLVPNEADNDQLKAAIAVLLGRKLAETLVQATESAFGWARIASQQQVDGRVDSKTFITPQTLATQFPYRGVKMFDKPGVFIWVVPAGVTRAWVEVYGGGGGGGFSTVAPGPTGGAGAGVAKKLVTLVPGASVKISVGAGGAGSVSNGARGGNGGDSSFGDVLSAAGGEGGYPNTAVLPSAPLGVGGDINYRIGYGHAPIAYSNGGFFGGDGGGGESAGAGHDPSAPTQPGMGGGGRTVTSGASGAPGAVRIFY